MIKKTKTLLIVKDILLIQAKIDKKALHLHPNSSN